MKQVSILVEPGTEDIKQVVASCIGSGLQNHSVDENMGVIKGEITDNDLLLLKAMSGIYRVDEVAKAS